MGPFLTLHDTLPINQKTIPTYMKCLGISVFGKKNSHETNLLQSTNILETIGHRLTYFRILFFLVLSIQIKKVTELFGKILQDAQQNNYYWKSSPKNFFSS